MNRRTTFTIAAALLVGAAALLVRTGVASAHGVLRASVPASGAHLAVAPRLVRLTFNERVEIAVARIELRAPDSTLVTLSALRVAESPETIVADVTGPLVAGTYTVAWQVAGRDGHPVRGRFRFTIAPGATGVASAAVGGARDTARVTPRRDTVTRADAEHHDPTDLPTGGAFDAASPAYAAVRWLGFGAMLGMIGAVAFTRFVVPGAARRGAPNEWVAGVAGGARRVGGLATAGLIAVALLRLAAQDVAMHGTDDAFDASLVGAMVSGTSWGTAWLIQIAAASVALAGFGLALRRSAPGWTLATAGAVGVALSAALSGHAAAVPRATGLAVVTDAAHVLGAGGWLGALLLVTVVAIPAALRLERAQRGPTVAAAVNAFSPLALACAGAVALTGAVSAWTHLGGVDALRTTSYGRTLVVKLAVLSLVTGTAFYNWRRVRPALGDEAGARRVRRSSTLELAVGALVLAVTAVLVATPTHAP